MIQKDIDSVAKYRQFEFVCYVEMDKKKKKLKFLFVFNMHIPKV